MGLKNKPHAVTLGNLNDPVSSGWLFEYDSLFTHERVHVNLKIIIVSKELIIRSRSSRNHKKFPIKAGVVSCA